MMGTSSLVRPESPRESRQASVLKAQSQWTLVLREFRSNRGAAIGAAILSILLTLAVLADRVSPYDPIKLMFERSLQPPSFEHLLGTDIYGRDILSRIILGARISLTIGLISVGIGAGLGIPAGLVAGWSTRWISSLIMRITDAMLALPGILLALAIVAVLGPGLNNAMIAVGIAAVPTYTRLIRSCVLSAKEHVYVDAARAIGCSTFRIVLRHILPNIMAPIIVVSTLGIGTAILSAASLSFLGLGAQPPTPEWGTIVSEGRDFLEVAWWISTFPSLAIMITVLSFNLMGDGLRDALDPRLRGR